MHCNPLRMCPVSPYYEDNDGRWTALMCGLENIVKQDIEVQLDTTGHLLRLQNELSYGSKMIESS